jgi:hypothetical protein
MYPKYNKIGAIEVHNSCIPSASEPASSGADTVMYRITNVVTEMRGQGGGYVNHPSAPGRRRSRVAENNIVPP